MPRVLIDTEDIVGKTFGKLTVVAYAGVCRKGRNCDHLYKCVCSCGTAGVIARRSNLLKGDKTSCGCAHIEANQRRIPDYVGRKFGRWTVLKRAPDRVSKTGKSRSTMWLCRCDCGTEKVVSTRALKTGMSQSCGCLQKERTSKAFTRDLLGQRFGYLTVVARNGSTHQGDSSKRSHAAVWHCVCDCGNEIDVPGWLLLNGDYSSCGCRKVSKYEAYTAQYLESLGYVLNVDYFKEQTYDGLTGTGGGPLRFDFLVKLKIGEDVLIECQGKQHYESCKYFGGKEAFVKRQANDVIKKQFAEKVGVKLIEVPYTKVLYDDVAQFLLSSGIH